jgi:hypothetical protein
MAELVTIALIIGTILGSFKGCFSVVSNISGASHEARNILTYLRAIDAILKSIRAMLRAQHRSQHFLDIWSATTKLVLKLVLANVKTAVNQLYERLGGRIARCTRLSVWKQLTWLLARDETHLLLQHLQGNMRMLRMVQNEILQ